MNIQTPAMFALFAAFLTFVGLKINKTITTNVEEMFDTVIMIKISTMVGVITYVLSHYNSMDLTDDIMLSWDK